MKSAASGKIGKKALRQISNFMCPVAAIDTVPRLDKVGPETIYVIGNFSPGKRTGLETVYKNIRGDTGAHRDIRVFHHIQTE